MYAFNAATEMGPAIDLAMARTARAALSTSLDNVIPPAETMRLAPLSTASPLAMPRRTGARFGLPRSPAITATVWVRPRFSPLATMSFW